MKVAIYTLGCRLNFAETEELIDLLNKRGLKFSFKNPDFVIVRGCSVTEKAEKETAKKIKELRKKDKNSFIIATGCLKKDFSITDANFILPKNKEKNLLKNIEKLIKSPTPLPKKLFKLRTRSFVKIQDGCQKYCTYCLIPYLRGKEKSKPAKEIIREIKEKEKDGYQEIVLTGVNISHWKEKTRNFYWLIEEILKETKIPRIRISSLWPGDINDSFLNNFKNPRLLKHLHLSLQSLSQSVLKRMGRNYKVKEIKNKIKKIRELFPDFTLTADIIVGFPNETEKEFKETLNNLKKIKLAKIHIFRYSPREGTVASLMKNQINEEIKKKRAKILSSLNQRLEKNWRKKFIKKIRNVLFEQKKEGFWQGWTDNYLRVYLKERRDLSNRILSVKLVKLYKDGILGKLCGFKNNNY